MPRLNLFSIRGALFLIILFLTSIVWLYIDSFEPYLVSKDQFRFLRLIEAHFNGTLGWQDFFTSHSEHVKPLYLLGFYLNSLFLGLDLRIEYYLGLTALMVSSLILLEKYLRSLGDGNSSIFVFATSLVISLQIFSFNQYSSYGFSQLMFGGYAQTLLFVCIFSAADNLWLRKTKLSQLLIVCCLIIFATFSFAGARMPMVILALISVPGLLFFYRRTTNPNLSFGFVILLVGFFSLLIYKVVSITPDRGGLNIERLLLNPKEVWIFFSSAISASILPVGFFRNHGWTNMHFASVGTILLILYATVLGLYLKHKLWKVTLIPFMMMIYGLTFALAITVARYGSGFPINTALAPRYVFDTQLGFIGVMWMFFLYCSAYNKHEDARDSYFRVKALFSVFLITVVTMQLSLLEYEWNRTKYRDRAWDNIELLVHKKAQNPELTVKWPGWYCPNDLLCERGLKTLEKHSLNSFNTTR